MNTSLKIDFRWYWMVLIYCFFMEIKLFLFFVMCNFMISIRYRDFMFKWSNWHQSAHNTPTSSSESQISCRLSITWWFRRGKDYVCGTKSYIMIIQIDVNLMLRLLYTRTLSFYKCTIYPATSVPSRCVSVHQTDASFG